MEEFRKIFSLVESSFPIFEEPERAAYCLKDSIGDDDLLPPIVRLGAFSCGSAALCGIGNCVRRQHTCAGSGAEGGAVEVACRRARRSSASSSILCWSRVAPVLHALRTLLLAVARELNEEYNYKLNYNYMYMSLFCSRPFGS